MRTFRNKRSTLLILALVAIVALVTAMMSDPGAQGSAPYAEEVIQGAEVVHVVSLATSLTEPGVERRTDTWVNQVSGDVTIVLYAADGSVESASMRRGASLTEYSGFTNSITTSEFLTDNHPALKTLTSQLVRYRHGLELGKSVTRVGTEEFNGRYAVKVKAAVGTEVEHTAYLDPETLFPIGIVNLDGSGYEFTYPIIETFSESTVPSSAFDAALPTATYHTIKRAMDMEDVGRFDAYPLHHVGTDFQGYRLALVQQDVSTGRGDRDSDAVYFTYQGEAGDLYVINRGPLNDTERTGYARAEEHGIVSSSESVTIGSIVGQLRPEGPSQFRLTLERADGVTYLIGADKNLLVEAARATEDAMK